MSLYLQSIQSNEGHLCVLRLDRVGALESVKKKRETDLGEGWDVIASRGSLDRYGRCDVEEILKSS